MYVMRRKFEVLACFKLVRALVEKHTSAAIGNLNVHEYHSDGTIDADDDELAVKVLRSHNGGEYLSNDFNPYLSENGIHLITIISSSAHSRIYSTTNGVAERMNRTLLDLVRSMLHHKSLPKHF